MLSPVFIAYFYMSMDAKSFVGYLETQSLMVVFLGLDEVAEDASGAS